MKILALAFAFVAMTRLAQAQEPAPVAATPAPAASPAAEQANAPASDSTPSEITLNIREKGTGKAVRRAEVKWEGQKTFADKNGVAKLKFSSSTVFPFKATIIRAGYETTDIKILEDQKSRPKDVFILSTQAKTTVVVSGKDEGTPSKKQVSIEEARRVAPGGVPANVVKVMPGVQTANRFGGGGGRGRPGGGGANAGAARPGTPTSGGRYVGPPAASSGIAVRGSPPEDSRFFVDDLEVPIVFHSIIDLSVVPGGLLSDVQFESGGFGSRFGNAQGGIIKLNTKSDIPESWGGEAVVNVPFYSGVFYRGRLTDDQALSASYRRSYIDFFLNLFLQRQAARTGQESFSISPVAQDAHVMHTQKTSDGIRKISAIYADDGVKAAYSKRYSSGSDQSLSLDAYTRGLTLGVLQEGRISESVGYRTTPQYVYTKTSFTISGSLIEASSHKLRAPTEFEIAAFEKNTLITGFDPDHAWIRQDTSIKTLPFFSGNLNIDQHNSFRVGNPATWVAWNSKIADLTVIPGVRGFYNTQIKKVGADPRLNSTYQLTDINLIKSAIGQYSRAPTFDQASAQFGNPALKYERTYHYILGVETRWNDAYTTEVQGFLKEGYDAVLPDREKKYVNIGRREVWGLELFARRNLTESFFGWATYTYSKTRERAAPSEPFRRSPLDQSHVGNLVSSYRLTPEWELSARYKYNTGSTYIPSANGGIYDSTRDQYSPVSQGAEKDLPPNQSMTLYVQKDFLQDTWKISVKAGMESFWFKPTVSGMRTNYDYTKETPQTGLSNIPFLEVQGVL